MNLVSLALQMTSEMDFNEESHLRKNLLPLTCPVSSLNSKAPESQFAKSLKNGEKRTEQVPGRNDYVPETGTMLLVT